MGSPLSKFTIFILVLILELPSDDAIFLSINRQSIITTMNELTENVLKDYIYDSTLIEKISPRKVPANKEVVPYDSSWPQKYQLLEEKILTALESQCKYVAHVGSTSVPNLPAKNIIDIDVMVADAADESTYVPFLEAVGFQLLTRERHYYEHRLFVFYDPPTNLHVYCVESAEVIRHRVFRDRLRASIEDRELYANAKLEAAKNTVGVGKKLSDYTAAKEPVLREILQRGFRDAGFIE